MFSNCPYELNWQMPVWLGFYQFKLANFYLEWQFFTRNLTNNCQFEYTILSKEPAVESLELAIVSLKRQLIVSSN